jgi:hypothetical protein
MMKNSVSKRDWETISAYLDNQLSQRDQARFESRLYNDRQLQAALDDIRRTRQVLRGAPRLRAPRDFLLTPEIAGIPVRIPRLAPVFGWASAVASFLLVLVLVGDFFTDGGFAPVDLISSERSEISESNVWPQPAITEDMNVSSKSIIDIAEESAPPEIRAEIAPMDTAAYDLPMESTALEEESVVGSQESELLAMENAAAGEGTIAETPEGNVAAAGVGEPASDLPPETPVEGKDEGPESDAPEDAAEVMAQSSVELTEDSAAVDSIETEAIHETPSETSEMEEIPVQAVTEELEQPTGKAAETAMLTDEQTFQDVPLTSDDSDTASAIDLLPADSVNEMEIIPSAVTDPINQSGLVLGVEVILAMGALGTGLAWIYTRRRVG